MLEQWSLKLQFILHKKIETYRGTNCFIRSNMMNIK